MIIWNNIILMYTICGHLKTYFFLFLARQKKDVVVRRVKLSNLEIQKCAVAEANLMFRKYWGLIHYVLNDKYYTTLIGILF